MSVHSDSALQDEYLTSDGPAADVPPPEAPSRAEPLHSAELGLLATRYLRHPEALRYLQLTREDVVRRGLVRGDDVRRFEHFMQLDALMYARASFPALIVCGGFNQWLFFLDDQYDNHADVASSEERVREIIDRAFDALSSGRLSSSTSAFDDFSATVGRRIRARASTQLWHRFLEDTHEYLYRGSRVAVSHWAQALSPADYRPLRRLDSSMNAVVDMVELAHDSELSAAELRDPRIRELRQLACDHVAFLNDLASYHKEVVRAGSAFNLLHCIALASCGGSIPQAIPLLVAELNDIITRFEALAVGLRGAPARHAAALRCMVAANHRFSFHSGRYHHPSAHLAELRGSASDAPR
jgi:hypothetical protein